MERWCIRPHETYWPLKFPFLKIQDGDSCNFKYWKTRMQTQMGLSILQTFTAAFLTDQRSSLPTRCYGAVTLTVTKASCHFTFDSCYLTFLRIVLKGLLWRVKFVNRTALSHAWFVFQAQSTSCAWSLVAGSMKVRVILRGFASCNACAPMLCALNMMVSVEYTLTATRGLLTFYERTKRCHGQQCSM